MKNKLSSLAVFAALSVFCNHASADTLAITSPVDYSTISTLTPQLVSDVAGDLLLTESNFTTAYTDTRNKYNAEYETNSLPVKLTWQGGAGSGYTVNVYRSSEYGPAAKPVFSTVTSESSVLFYDPEVGRNYTWTVSDGNSLVAGHFFTERNGPRIIHTDHNGPDVEGTDCFNGRDLGGWSTSSGKVVKQGLVYRSGELEFCAPTNKYGQHTELLYLKNVLGIKFDLDLRTQSDVKGRVINNFFAWQGAVDKSSISPDIPRFNVNAVTGISYPSYAKMFQEKGVDDNESGDGYYAEKRHAVWASFTNFCDTAKLPLVFHCQHGKDRAGSLAYVLLGTLGVSSNDILKDFTLSWYNYNFEAMNSSYGLEPLIAAVANISSYGGDTLADQCVNYLVECALDAGVDETTARQQIETFKSLMLEDPETAATAPASPGAATDLSASATYSTYPAAFTVAGSLSPGAGATTVSVCYSLAGGATQTTAAVLNPDGTFSVSIPYASASDSLTWYVKADSVYNGATASVQTSEATATRAADTAAVVYTWTGAGGDGKWANIANWSADSATAFGYPDSAYATAAFTSAADDDEIDLDNKSFTALLTFADNSGEIAFKNGTLVIPAESLSITATGTELAFENVTIAGSGGSFAATVGCTIVVRSGAFTVNGDAVFSDGDCLAGQTESKLIVTGALKMNGTYTLVIPAAGRTAAAISAGSLVSGSYGVLALDLTDYASAGNVPLATFANAPDYTASSISKTTVVAGAAVTRGELTFASDYKTVYYTETHSATSVASPAAVNHTYTGEELVGVVAGEGYTRNGVYKATDVGSYTATVSLNDGYSWSDAGVTEVTWSIAAAQNAWEVQPAISASSWDIDGEPGVLTAAKAKFGAVTATISKDNGAAVPFDGTLPTEVGSYVVTYAAETSDNWGELAAATVAFKIYSSPSDFAVYAGYMTYPEPKFYVAGSLVPGSGTTKVKVKYSVNSTSCDLIAEVSVEDDGTFWFDVAYSYATDTFTWSVEVSSTDSTEVITTDVSTITRSKDPARVTYYWTGGGGDDNSWLNIRNWKGVPDEESYTSYVWGYPGCTNGAWVSHVNFNKSTDSEGIDLDGGKYRSIDNGFFEFSENVWVKLNNGTLYIPGGKMTFGSDTAGLIGASGSTLVLNGVTLDNMEDVNLIPAAGFTIVYEGDNTADWVYNPTKANSRFVVRNGTLSGNSFGTGTIASTHTVEISNGVWSVAKNITNAKGIGPKVVFRDGEDCEAQFKTTGSLLMYGTYDIAIPAKGRTLPAVQAVTCSSSSSSVTFDLDVTDYLIGEKVPLVKFTSSTPQTTPSYTLNAKSNGVNVANERNASLTFEGNTLYYVQDDQTIPENAVSKPVVTELFTYDGTPKTCVAAGTGYTLTGTSSATEAGNYTVTLNLAEGYVWEDGTTGSIVVNWQIVKALSDPSWGYEVKGLGTAGNEVAVVFTNHNPTAAITWTAPMDLENVEFLVVGGGGGGGGDSSVDEGDGQGTAGCGGGGGGVITGRVFSVAANTSVSIVVGAGGAGGTASKQDNPIGGGAAKKGGDTYVSVGGVEILRADGGGRDLGYPKTGTTTAGYGGSNAGSRNKEPASDTNCPNRDSSYDEDYVSAVKLGKIGGVVTYATTAGQSGAGGGGATTPGENGTLSDDIRYAGNGGEGLASDITGTSIVYGSGGGGGNTDYDGLNDDGSASNGGTGAGDGNTNMDALPNQGGGGGGGGDNMDGGSGGSGIVVFRYALPHTGAVEIPTIPSKTYTGSPLMADVPQNYGYTVVSNAGGTDVGSYTVELQLVDGYSWSGETGEGASSNKVITWNITQAENSWIVEPSISSSSWMTGTTAGTLTAGATKFGTVTATISKNGAAATVFNGTLPTEVGSYVITYTAPGGTTNYTAPAETTKTVSFNITEYDQDTLVVTTNAMSNASWGYIVSNLGESKNETAVVFTNHTATAMTWTAPENLRNIEFLVVGGGGGGGGCGKWVDTQGGAGGGGGGVVTGTVFNIAKNATVTVNVGKGGSGGKYSSDNEQGSGAAGSDMEDSSFSVDGVEYIVAKCGGSDQGADNQGGIGGSNAGSRGKVTTTQGYELEAQAGSVGSTVSNLVNWVFHGNKGGVGVTNSCRPAGGGGGATSEGATVVRTATNVTVYDAGDGGAGLLCDITGTSVVYGSGGGGGSTTYGSVTYNAGQGGDGAGDGSTAGDGGSALANRGGGGGGGGAGGAGGDGGSGIVVLRYAIPLPGPVEVPSIPSKTYTGELLTADVDPAYEYSVVSNQGGTDVGEYVVELKLKEGFYWTGEDASVTTTTLVFKITQAANSWTKEPQISIPSWNIDKTHGSMVAGVATFGTDTMTATYTKDGVAKGAFTEMPADIGEYVVTYTVPGTDNYTGLTKDVTFTILAKELPTPVTGVTTAPITGEGGTDLGWGYLVSGLGEFRNETAVVFTNENASGISWTVPKTYSDVRFLVVGGGGGGGADIIATKEQYQGGGGGGGGGVVTGLVNEVTAASTVAVTVGRGGTGGTAGAENDYGAAKTNATDSSFSIGSTLYVTAYAGGRGTGASGQGHETGYPGAAGGSSAGNRPLVTTRYEPTQGAVADGAATYLSGVELFGNMGGASSKNYAAGGGGGALEEGYEPYDIFSGGLGGEGLPSDITGTIGVYGSGGGGGSASSNGHGGFGGTCAGGGNYYRTDVGLDALANFGGGGGGGGGNANGGNGGSGVVILRYTDPDGGTVVEDHVRAKILPQVYTGAEQTCNLAETVGYTVVSKTGNNIGEYEVTVTPKLDAGYIWEDGTTSAKTFTWTIVKAENAWTTEPGISKETWVQGTEAGAFTAGVAARFGTVSATMTEMPTAVGDYTVKYTVAGTGNYTGLEKTIHFKITESELTPVEKPVVEYPSGSVFYANGAAQCPEVTPAENAEYTVTYKTDFTSAGEHTLTISLADGYKWSNGTIGDVVYTYEILERNLNTYHWGATGYWNGLYRSTDCVAWYLDSSRTNKASTETFEPDSYNDYICADIQDGVDAYIDKRGVNPKLAGMYVSGSLTIEGSSLRFRNESSKYIPYITLAADSYLVTYNENFHSEGVGYVDIAAGSTFVAKRAVADQDIFVRFNTENSQGAVLAAQRCDTVSEFGWFEGGTPDSTVKIYIDRAQYGCIKFTNPDAVNGVAGPLAIDVGFNASETADKTLIEIAGTLNIQPGSTLDVDATGLGVGTYTVLSSARLNDAADLVRYGTAKNVKDGLYGTIVKSDDGNTINLVITGGPTVILDPDKTNPTVKPAVVYDTARIAKPISYPCKPHLFVDESSNRQVIRWGSVNVTVPIYYDAALDVNENLISMVFNKHATPRIENVKNSDDEITTDAIAIDDKGVLSIHFENTHDALYYALRTSTSIEGLKKATSMREGLLDWDLYTPDGGSAYIKGSDLGDATNYQFTPDETDTIRLFTVQVVDEIPVGTE